MRRLFGSVCPNAEPELPPLVFWVVCVRPGCHSWDFDRTVDLILPRVDIALGDDVQVANVCNRSTSTVSSVLLFAGLLRLFLFLGLSSFVDVVK